MRFQLNFLTSHPLPPFLLGGGKSAPPRVPIEPKTPGQIGLTKVGQSSGNPDPLSHQIYVVEDPVGNCSSLLLCRCWWTRKVEDPEKLPVSWNPKRCWANCSITNVCSQRMTIEVMTQSRERHMLQNTHSPKRLTEILASIRLSIAQILIAVFEEYFIPYSFSKQCAVWI